ncbi:MAG: putative zinc-binding protein [Planctomycetota bacterium]|nr:putative zinc-binding protein [Planctomycetota bacterium]|tara:strand:+ start:181 stop:552 length:372 start_codon:yes stop_codon:yes gene_type:complete
MLQKTEKLPLVYACSGCSNNAQLANQVALQMDREQRAEMSCIAGVGGNVPSMVKKAKSGRKIIALDGCKLHCVKGCLANHQVDANVHLTLTDLGLKKRVKTEFNHEDVELVQTRVWAHPSLKN